MRNKWLFLSGLSVVFAMSGIVNANLLINGDFESSVALTDTNDVPTGFYASANWEQWAWNNGWSEITVKPEANGGNSSILLNIGNGWYDGGGGAFQIVAVTEGQEYQLTVDSGADAWWQPTGQMEMIWLDATNGIISSLSRRTVDGDAGVPNDTLQPMQNYALSGFAPVGATAVKVEFSSRMPGGVGGSVTFDNANLQVIPEPATLGLVGLFGGGLMVLRRRLRL